MTRSPLSTALAAVVTVALLPLGGGGAPAAAATADEDAPLAVSIDTMTPSVVPRRGRLTLSGVVTNTSGDTWTDLQAYLVTSATPMTTREELVEATASDPATEVGSRLTDEGLYDEIGDLEPGESTRYTVSVRRQDLGVSGAPGVYWTGVHVLGAVDGVRVDGADGRARTLVPLLGAGRPVTDVALVVPLRERVRRASSGRLLGLGRWQRLLDDGRLRRLVEFAGESEGALTWLVDPAVLDAARSVAADNPPFDTGDDGSRQPAAPGESPSAGSTDGTDSTGDTDPDTDPDSGVPDGDGTGTPVDPGGGSDEEGAPDAEPSAAALAAADWLAAFGEEAATRTVLALPYGDLDVAAVGSTRLGRILRTGQELSARSVERLGLSAAPVVAPPDGLLPARALAGLDAQTQVLLADSAFPGVETAALRRPDGTEVVLLDAATAAGGPGPDDPTAPLALRQRLLAEAAVRSLQGPAGGPLVVSLPPAYDPGGSWEAADFFDGLEVPWLRQVPVAAATSGPLPETGTPPAYPDRLRRRHLPFANQLATAELVQTGGVFAHLLARNDSVADQLAAAAMLASSYAARARPQPAAQRARTTTARVRRTMRLVDVDGPPFVMMSSETGPIAVTVVNNLEEPVVVRLEARTPRDDISITEPDPVTLEPGQRAPVRMRADSTAIGVHSVTLVATTVDGEPIGSQVQLSVRTSNVGFVIWLVMAVGGAVLLVMIGYRITRRVRDRRTAAPAGPAADGTGAAEAAQ